MATFRKRSNAWQARIQRNGQPDLSKTFQSRSDAVAWALTIEYEIDRGGNLVASAKASLGDLLKRYLKEVTPAKRGSEVETYRINKWLRHPLVHKEVANVKSSDLSRWRDESVSDGLSANSIRLELAILSHLFNVAKAEWGFSLLENPTLALRKPKLPRGRTRRVDASELDFIAYSTESPVLPVIMTLAVETAMRRGEIASLQWEYVHLSSSTLMLPVTKNGDAREVPLSTVALKAIHSLPIESKGSVFNMTPHAISVAFQRACKRAGVNGLHFHDLRHEAISRFFERGLTLPEVSTISGHRTWTMLSRYTHLKAKSLVHRLG